MTPVPVRFTDVAESNILGLLMPFGGPFNGQDLYGEHFSAKTDFALDWFAERPLLFQHGLDGSLELSVVGRIKTITLDDAGGWMQAQLDKSSKYFESIRELIKTGKLFLSSGSMAHLVRTDTKTGEILRWPVIEGSLTPTPANLFATVEMADASQHFKAAGIEVITGLVPRGLVAPPVKMASWETVTAGVGRLTNAAMADGPESWVGVVATYSDHAIICLYETGRDRHYRLPFTLDSTGHVTAVGDPIEVEHAYVPVADTAPLAEQARSLCQDAAALGEYTKGLAERRLVEGRALSVCNRGAIADVVTRLDTAVAALRAFISTDTEPQSAKAASVVQRARIFVLATGINLN